MAMDDRYGRSDFPRQERYQDFDHRDRGRYQDNMAMDRRDSSRGMGSDRDGQVSHNKRQHVKFETDYARLESDCLILYCSTSQTETDTAETTGAEATTNAWTPGERQTEPSGLSRPVPASFAEKRWLFVLAGKEAETGTQGGRWTETDRGKVMTLLLHLAHVSPVAASHQHAV